MRKILVLFPNDWDRVEMADARYASDFQFEFFGDDLFKFPNYFKLLHFNVERFIEKCVSKIQKEKIDAIVSSDEYIGAILSAVVAQKCGLPGSDPAHIIAAQHKYHSRLAQQRVAPNESVRCGLIPIPLPGKLELPIPFPFFVKPVKGTFSLFAKRVDDEAALRDHMHLNIAERLVFDRITKPYNTLLHAYSDLEHDANYFVAEELISGVQVTVDGFVYAGQVITLGIVDSVMFDGTNIFERFEYPSRLPARVQARMVNVVESFVTELGYDHAQFNVELFYNADTETIRIIEINPRLSYQFADLYENVDGTNMYDIMVSLSLGEKPNFKKSDGRFSHSTSFVMRTFEGKRMTAIPDPESVEAFNARYSESKVKTYGRVGTKLSSEMRAIGSYRYGIVNVAADSLLDLFAIYEDALDTLPFYFE